MKINQINMVSDIRINNEVRVLNLFRSGKDITALDIQNETGISKPTVMKILQRLKNDGFIESAGFALSSGSAGKKPELFTFADNRKTLNVSFWPHITYLSLSGLVGEIDCLVEIPHDLSSDFDEELLWLTSEIRKFLSERGYKIGDMYAVVLSTSGSVDFRNYILRYNSQAPQWGTNVFLKSYLDQYLSHVETYMIENAGKVTGRAVLMDDESLINHRALTVFTTWGVSGCLIENGRVLNGQDFLIGEIGHMTVDRDSELCTCGKTGCLERLVSIDRVNSIARDINAEWYNQSSPIDFPSLFSLSKSGDTAARQIVKYLARCFSVMLHNMIPVYNPDVVIFQGNFAHADAYFDNCLRSELSCFKYSSCPGMEIRYDKTPLPLQSAKGAAYMVREYYFSGHCFDSIP